MREVNPITHRREKIETFIFRLNAPAASLPAQGMVEYRDQLAGDTPTPPPVGQAHEVTDPSLHLIVSRVNLDAEDKAHSNVADVSNSLRFSTDKATEVFVGTGDGSKNQVRNVIGVHGKSRKGVQGAVEVITVD